MATKVKAEKENYKPAYAAQPAKRKTDTGKILKALIFGPTSAILSLMLIYIAWWGVSKVFMALHAVVTAHFVPWVGANWPIILGIWALIAFTSVVYYFVTQNQKETKKESKKQSVKCKGKSETATIFDIEQEDEISEEELDNVGAYPYVPIKNGFSEEIPNI